jgi:hypothetical protein
MASSKFVPNIRSGIEYHEHTFHLFTVSLSTFDTRAERDPDFGIFAARRRPEAYKMAHLPLDLELPCDLVRPSDDALDFLPDCFLGLRPKDVVTQILKQAQSCL